MNNSSSSESSIDLSNSFQELLESRKKTLKTTREMERKIRDTRSSLWQGSFSYKISLNKKKMYLKLLSSPSSNN